MHNEWVESFMQEMQSLTDVDFNLAKENTNNVLQGK